MLWRCMTGDGVDPLHKIEEIMNRCMYEEHLSNRMQDISLAVEEIVFQHDRDPETYSEKRN